ncbi:MAG: DNA adenine methylase [Rikenellaceae bacterium]|nr:DNA adenine methylase [Rikenellaceae bacterium]
MAQNNPVSPFVKWVGGKRRLIHDIMEAMPANIRDLNYAEPFIGGGAVFFHIRPLNAVINDYNSELINVYLVVRDHVDELITDLKKHRNEAGYFYEIRHLDRTEEFARRGAVERASRFIFLNKTCYNGLYRVNNSGEFNTPFGKYKSPNIVNEEGLRAVSCFLNNNNIRILNSDYEEILRGLDADSFVYLDPPYHPLSPSSSFTGYIRGGWDASEQIRLRDACDDLSRRGIRFLLSNSCSGFIRELYGNYNIRVVRAARSINSVANRRGEIEELLISNYG